MDAFASEDGSNIMPGLSDLNPIWMFGQKLEQISCMKPGKCSAADQLVRYSLRASWVLTLLTGKKRDKYSKKQGIRMGSQTEPKQPQLPIVLLLPLSSLSFSRIIAFSLQQTLPYLLPSVSYCSLPPLEACFTAPLPDLPLPERGHTPPAAAPPGPHPPPLAPPPPHISARRGRSCTSSAALFPSGTGWPLHALAAAAEPQHWGQPTHQGAQRAAP